jgi:hypothetical protein
VIPRATHGRSKTIDNRKSTIENRTFENLHLQLVNPKLRMTAATSIYLQLGSASSDSMNGAKVVNASTPQELEACRKGLTAACLDEVIVAVLGSELKESYNPMELASWVPSLKANATVSVKVIGDTADFAPIHTSFLLAGLVSSSERREANGNRVLVATRKAASSTAAAPLKKYNTVTVSLDDNDDDMIDEDNLLSDNLLAPPPAMGAKTASTDDCSGRKPCDNCSCGRADGMQINDQQTQSSACGKCHMGDAFRCASCPHLGKPAFKAGEEHLVLQLSDDL